MTIETDVQMLALTPADFQQAGAGVTLVLGRLSKVPSNEWITCFGRALKESKNELLRGADVRLEREKIRYLTNASVAKHAQEGVVATIVAANEIARQANEKSERDWAAAQDRAAKDKADFEEVKRKLAGA